MDLSGLLEGMQRIQSGFATALPFRCNILRATEQRDDFGRTPQTFAAINLTPIPCMYQPIKGSEKEDGGELTAIIGYLISLPSGTDVTAKDRIALAAQGNVAAMTFEVGSVGDDSGVGILVTAQRVI